MLARVKGRAKKVGIPFDLTIDDLVVPEFCPVLGIKLVVGGGDAAPSLDRINNSLGYVRGNVRVVSHRFNRMKSDATLEELLRIAAWARTELKDPDQ